MGFITTRSRSGREVYACEFGLSGCVSTGCKALRCPFGYCQRYYACGNCIKEARAKNFTKQAHEKCRINSNAYAKREADIAQAVARGEVVINSASNCNGGVFLWSSNAGRQFWLANGEAYTKLREDYYNNGDVMTLARLLSIGGIVTETEAKNNYEYQESVKAKETTI